MNSRQSDGWTILHHAVRRDSLEMAEYFLEKGADPNSVDVDGETVLHTAAYSENQTAVRLLLERGANVNAADEDGWTVLHAACRSGNVNLVRMLVEEFHAIHNLKDADEQTPLDYVLELIQEAQDEGDEEKKGEVSSMPDYAAVKNYLLSLN